MIELAQSVSGYVLLLSGSLPVEEIAYKTGFSNRFHFSKTFKKFFKQPPVFYRKTRDDS